MINCEWGLQAIRKYIKETDVFIIIDILSFSTCVDIALSKKALVYPYIFKNAGATDFAKNISAKLATPKRSKTSYSLSPFSLTGVKPGMKIVLPSPNGSELSLACGNIKTLCASIRNCSAVASFAQGLGNNITVVPAGEKWKDGSTRFSIEDYIGAGAVISYLRGEVSCESLLALKTFKSVKDKITEVIKSSISGVELINKGFYEDILLASELNVSSTIPVLETDRDANYVYKSHIL